MITFKQQFDKLTEAYIRNEVNPFGDCNCFVGNLLNGNIDWAEGRYWSICQIEWTVRSINSGYVSDYDALNKVILLEASGFYTPEEIVELEKCFLSTYISLDGDSDCWIRYGKPQQKDEDALFVAFEKTLDLLKQIHKSKGEVVDDFVFTKRQLQTVDNI